ncbi:ABC transporter transmembrane domain-containing protein [Dermatophilaceae bacterium Soc4.6]
MTARSPLPPDLAAESLRTWDTGPVAPAVPPQLEPPQDASASERVEALRARHALRERRARDFVADSMNPRKGLPVAPARAVIAFLGGLLRDRRGAVALVLLGNGLAAVCALLVPRLLGALVDTTVSGLRDGTGEATLTAATSTAVVVAALVVAQSVLTLLATGFSGVLGQGLLAAAREHVVRAILRLPLSRVEAASSGDLVTRVTRDVGTMSDSVRWALPQTVVAGTTVVLTLVAMVTSSWLLSLPSLVLMSLSLVSIRRYLVRAPRGYLTEGGTYSRINSTLTETVEGARTVEALGLQGARLRRGEDDIAVSSQAERYTMNPAQPDVRRHGPRLQPAPGAGARDRCGRGARRVGHHRAGHDSRPLRRGAVGSLRPAGAHRRPGPGRGGLDHQAARHRHGATRPGRGTRPPRGCPPRRRGPALRLPPRGRRAPRHRPRAAAR